MAGLSGELHERWRRSWRQDMEELERFGTLRGEGGMDGEGEGIYSELLVVLGRALPILRRLGLPRPSAVLEGDQERS